MEAENMSTDGTRSTKVVGISGSLRSGSFNRKVLNAAASELPAHACLEVWDGLERVPPYDEDLEGRPEPPAVAELRRIIRAADGLLIATPEYNGSIPGQLKNALDWASRPRGEAALEGKPVATLSASPTPYGAARAQADLRRILTAIHAEIRGEEVAVPRVHEQFDVDGRLVDDELRRRLRALLVALAEPVTAAGKTAHLTAAAS
jgi:chromate reductase, NAD(P)H dehydrogenase (quinone)